MSKPNKKQIIDQQLKRLSSIVKDHDLKGDKVIKSIGDKIKSGDMRKITGAITDIDALKYFNSDEKITAQRLSYAKTKMNDKSIKESDKKFLINDASYMKNKSLENLLLKGQKSPDKKVSLMNMKYVHNTPFVVEGNKNKIKQYSIRTKGMTKEQIQKEVSNFSKHLKSIGLTGQMMTSIKLKKGFRGGDWVDIGTSGSKVGLYAGQDYDGEAGEEQDDEIDQYVVYFYETGSSGGSDKYNNCLYNCLKEFNLALFEKYFPTPYDLKKFLGLPIDAKVPIELIPKIEEKINVKINVYGEYSYVSAYNSQREINLRLISEHYSINQTGTNRKQFNKRKYKEAKDIIMYDYKNFEAYSETLGHFHLDREFENDIRQGWENYILVKRKTYNKMIKGEKVAIDIEEEYNEYIGIAKELREKTDGKINLYKSDSIKIEALHCWEQMTKTVLNAEPITEREAIFITSAHTSSLTYKEPGLYFGHKYDFKSKFPSIMKSQMCFPIKQGEFKQITEFSKYVDYGIYRCVVNRSDNPNINKLFVFNRRNFYTHIDVRRAQQLNLSIELIQDDQVNALIYSRDKVITGYELFRSFVDYMFELKDQNVKGSKLVLNILWGSLCQRKINKKYIKDDAEDFVISRNIGFKLKPDLFKENKTQIEMFDNADLFVTNFARIGPFLMSKAKSDLSTVLEPFVENCVWIHTDGFILTEKPNIKTGNKIGDLVYEKSGDCEVIHVNKVLDLEGNKF